jgi:hypothetical protein
MELPVAMAEGVAATLPGRQRFGWIEDLIGFRLILHNICMIKEGVPLTKLVSQTNSMRQNPLTDWMDAALL